MCSGTFFKSHLERVKAIIGARSEVATCDSEFLRVGTLPVWSTFFLHLSAVSDCGKGKCSQIQPTCIKFSFLLGNVYSDFIIIWTCIIFLMIFLKKYPTPLHTVIEPKINAHTSVGGCFKNNCILISRNLLYMAAVRLGLNYEDRTSTSLLNRVVSVSRAMTVDQVSLRKICMVF